MPISINTVADALTNLANGARMASPRGTVSFALEQAAGAVRLAQVACGPWFPDPEHTCPGFLVESIMEHGERGTWEASILTDEQVSAATVERSRVDDSYLRMRAGGNEWLIRCEYDGAPDGTPVTYHVAACGEVGRG